MKLFIFGVATFFLSISALVAGWHWALHPYFSQYTFKSGVGPPDDSDIGWIRQRYPIHFINPLWIHPHPFSATAFPDGNPKSEWWAFKYDTITRWVFFETWARVVVLFLVWFAILVFLHIRCSPHISQPIAPVNGLPATTLLPGRR
ncbi:MAG: hypothetical protein HY360_25630 [Verrucomicrobia bacterium]|nr:hypothetical protein [Verrucomicrobiota bacterium]